MIPSILYFDILEIVCNWTTQTLNVYVAANGTPALYSTTDISKPIDWQVWREQNALIMGALNNTTDELEKWLELNRKSFLQKAYDRAMNIVAKK